MSEYARIVDMKCSVLDVPPSCTDRHSNDGINGELFRLSQRLRQSLFNAPLPLTVLALALANSIARADTLCVRLYAWISPCVAAWKLLCPCTLTVKLSPSANRRKKPGRLTVLSSMGSPASFAHMVVCCSLLNSASKSISVAVLSTDQLTILPSSVNKQQACEHMTCQALGKKSNGLPQRLRSHGTL